MKNLGGRLVAAVNAGGNWTTSTVSACGPLYRNANNSRSNVNVNIGGRGSIQGSSELRLNRQIVLTRTVRRISQHPEPDGSHSPYAIVQFYFADDPAKRLRVVFTASRNILAQLDNPNMGYPCAATIRMMGKSFCLT